jgi:putative NIF3 family GTP cyclohydrolase 1 type 2
LRVPLRRIEKVAMADAMTERTVKQAAGLGAGLYITGTWRKAATGAVETSAMGVLVVGHARQERHALRTLASLLEQQGVGITLCMR